MDNAGTPRKKIFDLTQRIAAQMTVRTYRTILCMMPPSHSLKQFLITLILETIDAAFAYQSPQYFCRLC